MVYFGASEAGSETSDLTVWNRHLFWDRVVFQSAGLLSKALPEGREYYYWVGGWRFRGWSRIVRNLCQRPGQEQLDGDLKVMREYAFEGEAPQRENK